MTGIRITTAEELDALPTGSIVLDKMGDAGLIDSAGASTVIQYAETAPIGTTKAAKRFGPFTVVHTAGRPLQLPGRDEIAEAIADVGQTNTRVPDWPADEIEYFRHGDWADFTERAAHLDHMRRLKAADRVLALLRRTS